MNRIHNAAVAATEKGVGRPFRIVRARRPHPDKRVLEGSAGMAGGSAGLTSSLQALMRPFPGPYLASVHVFR